MVWLFITYLVGMESYFLLQSAMFRIRIRSSRIRKFVDLQDSDPLVRDSDPDLPSSSKNSKKTLDFYFLLICDFFTTFYL
jgi:hypothetical protein